MRSRRLAIGAWLVALAACIAIAARTAYVADLSSFLPANPTPAQRILVDQLREGALSRLMLVGLEGADAAARARVSRSLAQRLRADPEFAFVANGSTAGFEREQALLLDNRYLLSPGVTAERFTAPGLRTAIGETLDLLAGPAGLAVKSLVPRDPTGETLAVAEALRPQGGPPLVEGVWSSPDKQRAILLARTRAGGSDIDAQARAVASLRAAFDAARTQADAPQVRLLVTGPGVFAAQSRMLIEHDVSRLSLLSAALVLTLLFMAYRSARALVLGLVPVVSGALAGIAAVALGFGAVHGITLGFGITLIGEAVDYAIYVFVQRPGPRLWRTITLGLLTSTAGFSALVLSGLPGLAQLGVYSIVGLVAAALVTRFVLPALMPAGFSVRDLTPLGERLLAATALLRRGRWLVPALAVAAFAFLASRQDTLWDRDIASLNPIGEEQRRVDAELRAALGASDARVMIAVEGASADDALAAADRVGNALQPLVSQGQLAGVDNPARILPPVQTQLARIAALPEPSVLRGRLEQALEGLPLRVEKLQPFLDDVARARTRAPLTREAIAGTALDSALDGLLIHSQDGHWTALLGLKPASGEPVDVALVRDTLARARLEHATLLDVKLEVDRLYTGYFERAITASLAGFAVIVVLLFAALRSPRRVLAVLAPLAAGVLVVAAIHVLAGTRLTLFHLVALLLVVAVGSNYALFFDRLGQREPEAAPRTLASLLLANLTAVASFGALSLSSIPVLAAIGGTVALGAFLTLVFAAASSRHGIIPA